LINERANQKVEMHQTSDAKPNHGVNVHGLTATEAPPRVASSELLRGQRKLIIEHGDATYVLLLTRNGKLILNK
jgi:hemin uptake protein HemP